MIVEMKKVSLVVLDALREQSLQKLRDTGVLHLEDSQGGSDRMAELEEKRVYLERALLQLPEAKTAPTEQSGDLDDCMSAANQVVELSEREREQKEELLRLERNRSELENWGDFNPADIKKLEQSGVLVGLFH